MKRMIEIKHVGPKEHVRALIDELLSRLEDKLQHFRRDAVSVHVLFEENGSKSLCRTAIACHIPKHMIAARQEGRNPGTALRKAFAELERQLDRQNGKHHHRKPSLRELRFEPIVEME